MPDSISDFLKTIRLAPGEYSSFDTLDALFARPFPREDLARAFDSLPWADFHRAVQRRAAEHLVVFSNHAPDRAGQGAALDKLAALFEGHVLRHESEDHALLILSRSVRKNPALIPGVVPFAARIGPAFLRDRRPEERGRYAGLLAEVTETSALLSCLQAGGGIKQQKDLSKRFDAAAEGVKRCSPKLSFLFAAAADFISDSIPAFHSAVVLHGAQKDVVPLFWPGAHAEVLTHL